MAIPARPRRAVVPGHAARQLSLCEMLLHVFDFRREKCPLRLRRGHGWGILMCQSCKLESGGWGAPWKGIMRKSVLFIGILALFALALSGCVVAPPGPPPPPRVEVYGPAPYPTAVWVNGSWHYHSGYREWQWRNGHW